MDALVSGINKRCSLENSFFKKKKKLPQLGNGKAVRALSHLKL